MPDYNYANASDESRITASGVLPPCAMRQCGTSRPPRITLLHYGYNHSEQNNVHTRRTMQPDVDTLTVRATASDDVQADKADLLAGRMVGLLDVITRLPRQIWYKEDQHAHDQRFIVRWTIIGARQTIQSSTLRRMPKDWEC